MKKISFLFIMLFFTAFMGYAQNADFSNAPKSIIPEYVSDNTLATTGTWSVLAASPHAVSRSCCAAIKRGDTTLIYQFGGGATTQLTNVAKYNSITNTWTNSVSVMPSGISAGWAVAMKGDSLIYVIGGDNSTTTYGKCFKYNIITNTWTTMATMPTNPCTDQLTAVYHDSLIYCVGGGDGLFGTTIQYSDTRIYNTKTNTWSAGTSLPITLSMSGGGIIGDTIYIFSGASVGAYVANCYKGAINPTNPATIVWTALPAYPGGAITRMASFPVRIGSGGGIFCSGGAISGGTLTALTYMYNPCLGTFQTLTSNSLARSNFKGTGLNDSSAYIVAGYTTVGVGTTEKFKFTSIDGTCLSAPVVPSTWTEQISPLVSTLNSVSAVNDDIAWACGATGKVLRTTNKGVNWIDKSGNISTTYALENIFAWDANTAIVTGYNSTTTVIYQTSNGGTNWTLANTHTGFGDDLWMSDASTAYFIGDPISGFWDLLKSTNAGLNWASWASVATTNTVGTYNNGACFLGQQVWFASPAQSTMMYSSNMGANWSTLTTPLASITGIYFINSTTGFAGGYSASPGLITTTNGGTNWSTVTQSFIGTSTVMGVTGIGSEWWVATETTTPSAIYYTSNNGANWVSQYPAPAGIFYHLTKARTGNTLWAVRSNGGISRYGSPITGVINTTTETPTDYALSQNYPNPFNPETKINFSIPNSGLVTLKIYDIVGREVATLVNEIKNAGNYIVDFNASDLTSGVYFYKLEVNGYADTKKMMLIK
jgi:photosystem II stability/assembly factor-like uncharacterized protein